jgi:serine/threonine protein kinase
MQSSKAAAVIIGKSGTYALLEVIGKGAYGTVYKAIWREVGRHVAIKRVTRDRLSSDEEKALQAEIDLFKHLKHQHIVNYIEAVDADNSPFVDIVMEFVEGGSLFSIIQQLNPYRSQGAEAGSSCHFFAETVVASYIVQVLRGLCYLHKQGVVHRDIKGANILVTNKSVVKLADFGVASTKRGAEIGSSSANALDIAGTPYWMAPEIITLEGCSTVSDVWSVGCTVIELLTGNPPYHHLSDVTALFRIVTDDCPPLPDDISPDCQNFLRTCFNKDMNARASADTLLRHPWLRGDDEVNSDSGAGVVEAHPGGDDLTGWEEGSDDDLTEDMPMDNLNIYQEEGDEEFEEFEFADEFGASEIGASAEPAAQDSVEKPDSIDPFHDIMDDPEAARETERLRRHRELWQRVKTQVSALGSSSLDAHVNACNALESIFAAHPDQRYSLIYDPGLLPVLEVLERGCGVDDNVRNASVASEAILRVALSLLRNDKLDHDGGLARSSAAVDDDKDDEYLGYPRVSNIRHDLCLAGFLPAIMRYCDRGQPMQVRLLAARFINEMLRLESTLHMFVACRGFTVFVDMLEPDVEAFGELPAMALNGIYRLLSMEKQRLKRDMCRRFAWCGLLDRIVQGIAHSADRLEELGNAPGSDPTEDAIARHSAHLTNLARLLQTFGARSDPTVKTRMTTPNILPPIMRCVVSRFFPDEAVQSVLCCVRDLSRDPLTHSALQSACAIEVLVQYLSSCSRTDDTKTRHYIISSLHNLCIVSPARQEAAASAGLVPHLQTYIRSNDYNLRSLCIDMYSGLACAGHAARVELAKHAGLDFYVELLKMLSVPGTVRKWQARVLQSVSEWLDDPSQSQAVEDSLVLPKNCGQVCQSLAQMRVVDVEAVLEPYWRMITSSHKVNAALGASQELVSAMVKWLEQMYGPTGTVGGPRGRLLLLRILLAHAGVWTPESSHRGLVAALRVLLTECVLVVDDAITVREQSTRLLHALEGK